MLKVVRENLVDLPTNLSLSYFWCGGFMISFFLIVQVVTGVILSFLYVSDSLESFYCVIDLSKDSLLTWFIRYFHIWGVSYIFFLLFVHMARGLYYSSYSKLGV